MNHNAIVKSVPFFLSFVQVVNSSNNAKVFQFAVKVGNRNDPDRTTGGINASTPKFSSILFRWV